MIIVLDMESGLADSLANSVLGMDQEYVFRRWDAKVDVEAEIKAYQEELKGIIISGSAKNVNSKKYQPPVVPTRLFKAGVPILGICYGMQLIAKLAGQNIVRCWKDPESPNKSKKERAKDKGENGPTLLELTEDGTASPLFRGLGSHFNVWMKHSWMVDGAPQGWKITAKTAACPVAGLSAGRIHLVQFHPEPYYSLSGRIIMHNFLTYICKSKTPYF